MKPPNKDKGEQMKVKKPYQSPRLVVYGDLKAITTRTGANNDAGVSKGLA